MAPGAGSGEGRSGLERGLARGTVGLLCGSGLLPLRVAETLARKGSRVVAVGIEGEADPAIGSVADEMHWTGIAKLGHWIQLFKAAGAEVILMCGAIRKRRMFGGKAAMLPDWRSVKLWYGKLASKADHSILGAVAHEFEEEGIRVARIPECCPELLAEPGCLTRRRPTRRQWGDIRFGWPIAKQVAALQIGQCIVVKDRAVVAVEAIDGTDVALQRGGSLAGGDAVAVKVVKEGHDERFDIPCIGPDTADTMGRCGVGVLALEARRTILLDRDEVKKRADAAGVCIVALTAADVASTDA